MLSRREPPVDPGAPARPGSARRRPSRSARVALVTMLGLGLAASAYSIVGPARPAAADTDPEVTTYPLASDVDIMHADGEKPVITIDLSLAAGESRKLVGNVNATMDTNEPDMDFTTGLNCVNPAGAQAGTLAYAEVGLLPGDTRTLRPTLLLTVRDAGLYHCRLVVATGSVNDVSRMTVHKGLTYLTVSTRADTGAHMWLNPLCDSPGHTPDNPPTDVPPDAPRNPDGSVSNCTYIGEGSGPKEVFVFDTDGSAPYQWTAAPGATLIGVTANVEATECGHTASCGGRRHDGNSSTVRSHLEVIQLDAAGRTCNVTRSSDQTDTILIHNHHYNIAYGLPSVPVLATCGGSRRFIVRVDVVWVSGNSVKIDGTRPDPLALTNAVATNGHQTSTATVPSVVGASLTAAQNAISAAHLTTGTVTSVINPAPAGTVLAQNAPAGTVEPINSPVNLTVSTGSVTVPNVRGFSLAAAQDQIWAANLALGRRSTVNDCLDQGNVEQQSPAAGTVVAPGSTVDLTTSTCTTPPAPGGGGGNPRQPV